jgi:RNA polymerase sigma-70 factor (ECF subfamily)
MIYRLALRLMEDEAEAEEVVQETFLNAFRAIGSFEGRSGLGTWLYRIAHNTAMMRLRQASPQIVSIDDSLEPEGYGPIPKQLFDWCCLPESSLEDEEVRRRLDEAIRQLPESLRQAFILREVEGLSTEEAAAVMGLSENAVKVRLHRARARLRDQLSAYFVA